MENNTGSATALLGLDLADKQIALLRERFLPHDPHLLTVPTSTPFRNVPPFEKTTTPFEEYEVKYLQYMTLISSGSRGVARTEGDWQARIEGRSPASIAARSSTTTPNPAREAKVASKKISIADYKNMKKTGVRPSPRPEGDAVGSSQVSMGTPMSRGGSFEGAPEVKVNGASVEFNSIRVDRLLKENAKPPAPTSNPKDAKSKTNGHVRHTSNSLGISHIRTPSQKSPIPQAPTSHPREAPKHQLPPRPQSPKRSIDVKHPSSSDSRKRLQESDGKQAEKRTKIEHSRTPSGSQNSLPRRPDTPEIKISPSKISKLQSQSTPSRHSPLSRKTTPDSRSAKKEVKSEKQAPLPPMLAPLPKDYEDALSDSEMQEEKLSSQPRVTKVASDTIVVKKPRIADASPLTTPPKSSRSSRADSPLLPLPPPHPEFLSDAIERELARLQAKATAAAVAATAATTASHIPVKEQYEKARRPDASGVARKTVTPKVGHPPKRSHAESSKSQASSEKPSLIVKLKYKKRNAKAIERILKLGPTPNKDFLRLEKERLAKQKPPSKDDDESEDEPPLATITAKPPPSKKRPSDINDRLSEPAPKRAKLPDIDISKAKTSLEPPFRSPAPSQPPQKNLLATPKRGDAMKSVAMRRVDSNDGNARTPQTMSTSTPASAEKPRLNGEPRPHSDLHLESKKLDETAFKLKRRMDEILQNKVIGGLDTVSDGQKQLGWCVALECVAMYMVSFAAKERLTKTRTAAAWEGGITLWGFIDYQVKNQPVFHALSTQLGALLTQELGKVYLDSLKAGTTDAVFLAKLAKNGVKRDLLWKQCHHVRGELAKLGFDDVLGPWTTVDEAKGFVIRVLDAHAKKNGTPWKATGV